MRVATFPEQNARDGELDVDQDDEVGIAPSKGIAFDTSAWL